MFAVCNFGRNLAHGPITLRATCAPSSLLGAHASSRLTVPVIVKEFLASCAVKRGLFVSRTERRRGAQSGLHLTAVLVKYRQLFTVFNFRLLISGDTSLFFARMFFVFCHSWGCALTELTQLPLTTLDPMHNCLLFSYSVFCTG